MTKANIDLARRVEIPKAKETRLGANGLFMLLLGVPFSAMGSMLLAVFNGTPIEATLAPFGIVAMTIAGVCLVVGLVLSLAAEIRYRRQLRAISR